MSQENFNNDSANLVDNEDNNFNEKQNNQSDVKDNTIDKDKEFIKNEESPIKALNNNSIETENDEQNVNSVKNKNIALNKNKSSKNLFLTNDYNSNEVDFTANNMSLVRNSNLNNSDFNLNNSNNEDDIMAKINKEAQKFENNVISGDDIYDKFGKLTNQQYKDMIKEKNKHILNLSENQETYKKELSNIIDQLNVAFDKFTLSSKMNAEKNNALQYKIIEQQIAVKAKELINVKNQLKLYKKQYEIVNTKANEKFTTEKISEMEEQIGKLRKDNIEQSNKLKKLKNMQYTQGKELETNNLLKKFPNQINAYTDEIKNLVSKKQEYLTKISNNKKSLSNLKNILTNISKNYEKIIIGKSFQRTADNIALMQSIEESIENLKKDLHMSEEELIEKINNLQTVNKYTYINNEGNRKINLLNAPKSYKSKTLNQENSEIFSKNISPNKNVKRNIYTYGSNDSKNNLRYKSPELVLPKILPPIVNKTNKERSSSPYKGIFNKYEYLSNKEKINNIVGNVKKKNNFSALKKNPNNSSAINKRDSSIYNRNSEEKNFDSGDEMRNNISDDEINLNLDYEHTHNIDYHNLQKKEDQLIKINSKLEKNVKEIEKLYDKKFQDIQKVIEQNQNKLKIIQQKNELLAVEIADLTKILKLNVEEIKLKREIKDNESKILKSVILNTNDVSQTRTDILNELNTILKEEQNNKNKKEIQGKESIIKEEHGESNNSLMNNDMEEKQQPIKFPDISNVEHIDDETINPSRVLENEQNLENEGDLENDDKMNIDVNNHLNVDAVDDKLILETEKNHENFDAVDDKLILETENNNN